MRKRGLFGLELLITLACDFGLVYAMSKPAFLFPGQGAQTVGMGRQLVESTPRRKEVFERAKADFGL